MHLWPAHIRREDWHVCGQAETQGEQHQDPDAAAVPFSCIACQKQGGQAPTVHSPLIPRGAAESLLPAWCAGQAADAQQPLSAPQQQYLQAARQARQHQVAGTQSQFSAVDAFVQACPEERNGK